MSAAPSWPHAGIPVVDGHVHVNRFDWMKPVPREVIRRNPTFPLMERFVRDADAFLRHMDQEGVWQSWLINYSAREVMGYGWDVNPWVADYVRGDPERLVAVGGYDPRTDGDGCVAVERLRDMEIRILKLHPVHQHMHPDHHRDDGESATKLQTAYQRAQELAMPIIFHTGTSLFPGADNQYADPARVAPVLEDFGDLQVIIAHGGRPHHTHTAIELVRQHDNAWLDLSSCPPKRLPDYFGDLEELAPRTLWGSDWPGPGVPGMGANIESFLELGLPQETNEAILHDNATALLARAG